MPKTTLAPIARWTIKHEQVVAMHIGGMDNGQIAANITIKGKNPSVVRVSQILSDPQALRIINEAMMQVRSEMMENLDDGLAALAVTAMARIRETIDFPDFILGSDEKRHQDRLSLDLVKLVYSNNSNEIGDAPPLDAALSKRIAEAIEASNAVEELIREGQFKAVEDE